MKILMDLHVLSSPETENLIFEVWLRVCVFVISITQKQITAETSNSTFVSYTDATRNFHKDRTKTSCRGAHKEILIH